MSSLPRVRIEEHTAPSEALLDVICALEEQIFDVPYSSEKLRRRMVPAHRFLGLIATVRGEPVGYELGYLELQGDVSFVAEASASA